MMGSGVAMMLKSLLGIEPEELERQIKSSAQAAFDLLQSINARLGNIENQLTRIERNGVAVYPSETALEKFYGDNPETDFFKLQGLTEGTPNGEEKIN